jgi:fatty acid desaturase
VRDKSHAFSMKLFLQSRIRQEFLESYAHTLRLKKARGLRKGLPKPYMRRMERHEASGSIPSVRDFFSAEEVRALIRASDSRGWLAILASWSVIAGSMAFVAAFPHPLTILAATVLIGGRQLALAILMHECAHRSLFATRSLNDWAGKWLCAAPLWHDLERYRAHHLRHHRDVGTEQDPDLDLVTAYPVSRVSLWRKFARDLCGLTGIKRLYGHWMMDSGRIQYTVSGRIEPLPREEWASLPIFLGRITPFLTTQTVLLVGLAWVGYPALWALWWLAYLTTHSLFIRIRSIAEHAVTELGSHPWRNTRTTRAGLIARLTVAPHRVNYHLEHHLLMTVPHFRLPEVHARLQRLGAFELTRAQICSGYGEVLRLATR